MHDWQLLREYVEQNSQTAFAALVERHANLVYSTCLREVNDAALAEDVAQVVFVILARKAASLREGTVIAGWLFQTARFACKNALKQERRRQQREQKAAEEMMSEMQSDKTGWANLEPLLHDGLAALGAQERDAVLLRFFENRSLRDTGAALGISEDAARMRVARALEKLRRHFARHGYAASVVLLGALLSEHAVHAAPASCLAGAAQLPTQIEAHSGATAGTLTGALSPKIASLSHGVLRSMLVKKIGAAAGIGALLIGGGALSHFAAREGASSSGETPSAVMAARREGLQTSPDGNGPKMPAPKTQAAPVAPLFSATRAPIIEPNFKAVAPSISDAVAARETSPTSRRAARTHPPRAAATAHESDSAPSSAPQMAQAAPVSDELIPAAPTTAPVTNPVTPGALADSPPEVARDAVAVPVFGTDADSRPSSAPEVPQFVVPGGIGIGVRAAKAGKAAKARRRAALATQSDLRGRIVGVNESDASIRIKAPGEAEKTILIPADARIFVDNKAANLEDIQAGMGARIRLADGQSAFAIRAHAPLLKVPGPRPDTRKPAKEAKKKKLKTQISTP